MNDDARPPQLPRPPDAQASQPPRPSISRARPLRLVIAAAALILIASLVGILASGRSPFSLRSASTAPGSSPTSVDSPRAPADKQILRILDLGSTAGDLGTIDPAYITSTREYDKAQLVFPELITLDDSGKSVDWAARSHEVSSDGLTYTFHLRSGMRWSDGAPINATTFAYSMERTLDPCTGSSTASYLYHLKGASDFNDARNCSAGADGLTTTGTLIGKSIVVADALTIQLILEAPATYFLGELSYPTSWAVPKQLIDKYADMWTDHLADGAGFGGNLYKVTQWDHAGHFALAANDTFWGQKPILQKIEWTLYQTVDTAWADYLSGIGDVGFPPATNTTSARTLPGYSEARTLSVYFLRANWALAPFDDVRVRNAFSLAIDRTALATAVFKGSAAPTIHMIIEGVPGYNPTLKNAAGDSGDKTNAANVAKATELAKAYATDKCGGDFSRCSPVVFTYPTISQAQSLQAQVLQQEWQTAFPGWNITLQGRDRTSEETTFSKLQLAWDSWSADYPDPQDFTSLLWAKDANYNLSSVDVPAADALEQQGDVSSDATGRLAQYQQAEQLLINQGAFMALEQPLFRYVVRPAAKLVKWRVNVLSVTAPLTYQQAYITM